MNLDNINQTQVPMGIEKETVLLSLEFRDCHREFFDWIIQEERVDESLTSDIISELKQEFKEKKRDNLIAKDKVQKTKRWFLSKWDIEYFYTLSRPVEVSCSCPFGWMEKVESLVEQQYPIFGRERFPDLHEKAAHFSYLIIRNVIFPSYNEGVAVLAALVMLMRNGEEVKLQTKDLKLFMLLVKKFVKNEEFGLNNEEDIKLLGQFLKVRGVQPNEQH